MFGARAGGAVVVAAVLVSGCAHSSEQARAGSAAVGFSAAGSAGRTSRGLSATGTGSATVRADRAVVVVGLGTPGSSAVSTAHQATIVGALAKLGFAKDAIDFTDGNSISGSTAVRVKVRVDALRKTGTEIVAAIRGAVDDSISSQGVLFSVSDCGAALAPAQRRAAEVASKAAVEVAATTHVRRGRLISATDATLSALYASALVPNVCGGSGAVSALSPFGVSGMPFDSKPEVTVHTAVTLTYEIANTGDGAVVTGSGDGTADVPAGDAYVVVNPSGGEALSLSGTPAPDHRKELIAAIAALGIRASAISVSPSDPFPGSLLVRVEVRADQLPAKGDAIERAVHGIMGGSQSVGVLFIPKDCAEAKRKARELAFAQADHAVEQIASGLHVRLGEIVGVTESSPTTPIAITSPDPCAPDIDNGDAVQFIYGAQYLKPLTAPHRASVIGSIQVTRATN
jgi:hypothetical protein